MAESQSTRLITALDDVGDEIIATASVLHGPQCVSPNHADRRYYEGYIAGLCFARQCIEALD